MNQQKITLNLLFIFSAWLMLIVFSIYIYMNIGIIGQSGGIGLPILVGFFVFSGILITWRFILVRNIVFKKSLFFILLFYAYFLFRIGFDKGDYDALKEFTIGTTGGTFFFYLIGLSISIVLSSAFNASQKSKLALHFFSFFTLVYLIFSTCHLTYIISSLSSRLRADIILINDIDGDYQRSGCFLLINFLLFSFSYFNVSLANQRKHSLFHSMLSHLLLVVYITHFILATILSQMIGSNNALVSTISLFFITISIRIFFLLQGQQNRLLYFPLKIKSIIFSKTRYHLFISFYLGFFLICIITAFSIIHLDIDINKLRILNFGKEGGSSSVNSRLEIAKNNFFIHFQDSPFLGNMNIDATTTGKGSYVHSLFGSLLTHTGLFGLLLFSAYLITSTNDLFSIDLSHCNIIFLYTGNGLKLFSSFVLICIIIIATFGTFLTWAPLWFAMGLLLTPISIRHSHFSY